jgi:hypothetical protein
MKAKFVFEFYSRGESNIYKKIGIGRKTWNNLQPGDILKPKKEVYIGSKTNFVSKSSSYDRKIWEESYISVIDTEKTPGGKLKVYYYQAWDLDQAKLVSDNIDRYTRGDSMTGPILQFERRFDIL